MKKKTTAEINANYLANLFEEKANEILEKEKKATKKKATKKAETVAKAEITEKAEKPKTVKKATKKATEKVENSDKSQSTEKPKKVVKKATKAVEKTAEKEPKKATKKAKAEVEQESEKQELRPLTEIKIAKTEYILDDTIKSYDDLVKAIEDEKEVFVAFDISEVDPKEYENIFHVPFEKSMKEKFDICTPIFVGEKNPRLVFASVYTEALWDLFPDEFELLSAVLIEKPKKAKK